jgi:hypothetical protein
MNAVPPQEKVLEILTEVAGVPAPIRLEVVIQIHC